MEKSVIKWVGGKSQIIEDLINRLPENTESITTYIEPFIGGCTVMLNIIKYFPNLQKIVIADLNSVLTNLYTEIKNNPEELIDILTDIETYYKSNNGLNAESIYYEYRSKFNENKNNNNFDNTKLAAYFIFLNKTCFNGLYRENKKGLNNVPWNKNIKQTICDNDSIMSLSKILNDYNVIIECSSYDETVKKHITEHSFIYFDPPYRPLNKTSAFTAYTKSGFNDDNQVELKYLCDMINNDYNSYFMLSNSDPKNTDINDTFFDDLYQYYHIERVSAARSINSKGDKRGKITEILVTNY